MGFRVAKKLRKVEWLGDVRGCHVGFQRITKEVSEWGRGSSDVTIGLRGFGESQVRCIVSEGAFDSISNISEDFQEVPMVLQGHFRGSEGVSWVNRKYFR